MISFTPRALATGIGSLPHPDPQDALDLILSSFPAIPFWPQLPHRDFRENMYAQFSEDLVGLKMDLPRESLSAVIDDDTMAGVEVFYARYLENDPALFAVSRDYAAGLYALRERYSMLRDAKWIKGQVTGPISFGLKVVDQNLRPMLYDDALRDVLVKHLARKAQWQERFLSQPCEAESKEPSQGLPTIIFVDEPSLALIGASMVALNRDEVVRDLEEVFSALSGLKATHCCGNTDWSLLLETSVNVISFDAYIYAENLALFADHVKRFLDRGGALAWGIVPTVEEQIAAETEDSLVARLDAAIGLLVKKGIDRDLLYERALITPACGLGTLSISAAERAFALTRAVSERVRERERLG
ncbi:MAG: methionine synthase [Chloroflexota bacterium]|nr:methionine synthase [Chloroflexota bacterium]